MVACYLLIPEAKMGRLTIPKKEYLRVAQYFHWAKAEHYRVWFNGEDERHGRTEKMLPRLVRAEKLKELQYGKKKVYAAPRLTQKKLQDYFFGDEEAMKKYGNQVALEVYKVEHGLACTEGLVRLWRSDTSGTVIPEKYFRSVKLGTSGVPEWGIIYPKGSILLYEHCTEDNFYRPGNVKKKVDRYREKFDQYEHHFNMKPIFLFVLDVPRIVVERFVSSILPAGDQFFFTDYEHFLKSPIGKQLDAPIYIWGEDGKEYPLRRRDA